MEKMKGLWGFMINNLADQWTRFSMMVMNSGVFDFLKAKLKGVLDWVNALAESGKMQLIATDVGKRFLDVLRGLWEFGRELASVFTDVAKGAVWLKNLFGSWKPILAGVAAILAGPLLLAIGSLALALKGLGVALMMTPVGRFLAAVAAIVGAAALIYDNWGPIKGFFADLWAGVTSTFDAALRWITEKAEAIARVARKVIDALPFLKGDASDGGLFGSPEGAHAPATVQRIYGRGGAASPEQRVGGRLKIEIESDHPTRIRELRSDSPDFDLDVDAGLAMVGP